MEYKVSLAIDYVLSDDPRTDAGQMKAIAQLMETVEHALEGLTIALDNSGGYTVKEGRPICDEAVGGEYGVRLDSIEKIDATAPDVTKYVLPQVEKVTSLSHTPPIEDAAPAPEEADDE